MKRHSNPILHLLLVLALLTTVAGCKKKPDDAALTKSIQEKLQAMPGVSVAVAEGVATLTGEVDSEAMIAQAEAAAKGVEGVKSVVNSLTVKPAPVPEPAVTFSPDDSLKTAVEENFKKYNVSGVTASVQNGEITLTGNVKRSQLQDIIKAANEAKPKKVNNQLNISK
ncbi:MAG: BON domain-containing protein [Cytophagales bacterium]|jgi:osmotically-inducible protein OsmY|nr:BON domain-containing protein [Cytophagales bacterium]